MSKIIFSHFDMVLSEANSLHCLIIQQLINTQNQTTVPKEVRETIQTLIKHLQNPHADIVSVRASLLHFYASMYPLRQRSFYNADDDFTDLIQDYPLANERQVALKIAQHYYQHLNISYRDVKIILDQYLLCSGKSALDLNDDFIKRIASTKLYHRRFSLIQFLPDHPQAFLLKQAVAEIKRITHPAASLIELKNSINEKIDKYLGTWLLRLFNQHNQRASAIKKAIQDCTCIADMLAILQNQIILFSGGVTEPLPTLSPRWSLQLKNKPQNVTANSFYQAIVAALAEIPEQPNQLSLLNQL